MGLDWQLMSPPQRGKTKIWRELRAKLNRCDEDQEKERERLLKALARIEVDPFTIVHAPILGVDDAATGYLRTRWRTGQYGRTTFKSLLEQVHGQPLLELAEPKEALPLCPTLSGPLDFRGQQLAFCEHIIGHALLEEAYEHHSRTQMVPFAQRLQEAADQFRAQHPRLGKKDRDACAVVEGAACWLGFWGSRGFSYHAWF